jgi:micrococcal nuclease
VLYLAGDMLRAVGVVAAVLLASVLVADAAAPRGCAMPRKPAGLPTAAVVRVVDGDTLVVQMADGRRQRLRLIGVDSPETHAGPKLDRDVARSGKDQAAIRALGARASRFTRERLAGRAVSVELDVQPADRYGRLLAYVWVGDELYNAAIVREGYAGLMTVPPNVKYRDLFAACYAAARGTRSGLWGLE